MGFEIKDDQAVGSFVLAKLPTAARDAQRFFGEMDRSDDADALDPSRILSGSKAVIGAAAVAAAARARTDEAFHQHQKDMARQDEARELRELEHLAVWNRQETVIGGVRMTNGEAQEARQRFIDNEDFYAERAVRLGHIEAEDKEDLKRGMRREKDLKDREGRGTMTEAERDEQRAWESSKLGQAGGKIIARLHQRLDLDAGNLDAKATPSLGSNAGQAAIAAGGLFQAAPPLLDAFNDAQAGGGDSPMPSRRTPPGPSPAVKATGLDL